MGGGFPVENKRKGGWGRDQQRNRQVNAQALSKLPFSNYPLVSPRRAHPLPENQLLSGPVLRDTARLSQRYPAIARYGVFWCLNMTNWVRYAPPS